MVAAGDSMKKFSKLIFFVYFGFYLVLLLDSDSLEKRFRPGVYDRVFSIYFVAGIFVLPFLIYGLPSAASIRAEISSDRVRRSVKRKLQTVSISVALIVIVGLTRYFVPPHDVLSLTVNIVVFLTML